MSGVIEGLLGEKDVAHDRPYRRDVWIGGNHTVKVF